MKKIAIVVNSRANYARIKSVLLAMQSSSRLEVVLILGASALVSRYGNLESIIQKDGLEVSGRVNTLVEGDNPSAMATSTGLAIIELTSVFENLKPDMVLTVADRFETLGTAVAASYMNIPLAHTQGGEITGSIDESVRHAVTKLAHYHFPATQLSMERLRRMGENPSTIFLTGCPSIDLVKHSYNQNLGEIVEGLPGVGVQINPRDSYTIVLQHPDTSDWGSASAQISGTIQAISEHSGQVIWLWPNVDAGSDVFSKEIRRAREFGMLEHVRFVKNLPPEHYLSLLSSASCIVGNSSSALREGSFLGVPAVNIGSRQMNRERGRNVLDTNYSSREILSALTSQLAHGKYSSSRLFGDGDAAQKIIDVLEGDTPFYQKTFID